MNKQDFILLSIYKGYCPIQGSKTVNRKNDRITIFYDDVILEPENNKAVCFRDYMVDKRYRKFVDYRPVNKKTFLKLVHKFKNDSVYKKTLDIVLTNKILLIVKGKIAVYRYSNKEGVTYTERPDFLAEKSPYSSTLRGLIVLMLRRYSAQQVKNKLSRKYNITISLSELYKIKNKQN